MKDFDAVKINANKDSLTFSNNKSQVHKLKGRNLIGCADNYVVIDTETTGLDFSYDEIIEIAAAKVENGRVIDKFTTLIRPEKSISDFITELTGISNEMLEIAPSAKVALGDFVDYVGNSLLVGHNVKFDLGFLYANCQEKLGYTLSNDFLDTLRLSRMLFAKEKQHKLVDLVNRFGIGHVVEHRALGDVLQTQKCYEYMLEYAVEHNVKMKHLGLQSRVVLKGKAKTNKHTANTMNSLFTDLEY